MWSNDYRFTPPPQCSPSTHTHPHTRTHTLTNRNTNMFSSGGLFNYFAFSLQITQEHLGLGEQREWCGESDDGIRWIPMVLLELDLPSQFSRGRRCFSSCYPALVFTRHTTHTLAYRFTVSDGWEKWEKDDEKWEVRGGGDRVKWRKANMREGYVGGCCVGHRRG